MPISSPKKLKASASLVSFDAAYVLSLKHLMVSSSSEDNVLAFYEAMTGFLRFEDWPLSSGDERFRLTRS